MVQSLDFQQPNLFILRVREEWTSEEVEAIAEKADEYTGDNNVVRCLIDLSQTADIPPAAREMITKRVRKDVTIERAAVFGAGTRIRFLGTLVPKILSSVNEFKFFDNEDEAYAWVTGGKR